MKTILMWILRVFLKVFYKIDYRGFEKIKNGPVILIANHISYLDGIIIYLACNGKVRFLVDGFIASKPVINYVYKLIKAIPVKRNRESVTTALLRLAECLDQEKMICIFPEGRISSTGRLQSFKRGVQVIARKYPQVPIYPILIEGLYGSVFSRKYPPKERLSGLFKSKWFSKRKVKISVGDPIYSTSVSKMRKAIKQLRG